MPSLTSLPLTKWSRRKSDSKVKSNPPQLPVDINEKDGFGLPPLDDPDPFGVLALEKAGLVIKEAGTHRRVSSDAFEYRPSPTSPIFSAFGRRSIESASRRSSRRASKLSIVSLDRGTQTADFDAPTVTEIPPEVNHSPIKKTSEDLATIEDEDEMEQVEEEDEEEPEVIIEEPLAAVHIVAHTAGSPIKSSAAFPAVSRAKLVTIPKRIPPVLPMRSPYRRSGPKVSTPDTISETASIESQDQDISSSRSSSPTKSSFYGNVTDDLGNPWTEDTVAEDGKISSFSSPLRERFEYGEKVTGDNDEFHSMPSTPIESVTQVAR
ncbi:hypothetical protein MMC14_008217 [Varicellaria rhodocarpa]|nr:hypothetical protein [Varicellaria rhodocarpa]